MTTRHARLGVITLTLGLAAGFVPAQAKNGSAFLSGETEAVAASPPSYDEAARQLDAAWNDLPLQMRKIMFVSEAAPVYGAYTARADAIFKPSDKIQSYIEPAGYSYKPGAEGFVRFGVVLDFEILQADGTVAAGKKDFLTWSATSRAHMKEMMLNASLNFDGIPEGRYVLRYTLHDINTGRTAEASLPFTIAP